MIFNFIIFFVSFIKSKNVKICKIEIRKPWFCIKTSQSSTSALDFSTFLNFSFFLGGIPYVCWNSSYSMDSSKWGTGLAKNKIQFYKNEKNVKMIEFWSNFMCFDKKLEKIKFREIDKFSKFEILDPKLTPNLKS